MQITVSLTQQELDSINLVVKTPFTPETLSEFILNKLDSASKDSAKIFHQTELGVDCNVKSTKLKIR
jgi:hypothetical protein